jgi:hypothetical protein
MAIHQRTAAAKTRAMVLCAFALGVTHPAEPAFAQTTPGTAGPISLGELFAGPESVELTPGAAEKLLEAAAGAINPGADCPQQANFKVIVKRGDLLFQQALAAARRDTLITALKNQNFPDSRYEFIQEDWQGSANDVQVSYSRMRDRQRPNLHTSSVPPKGTKVKPGDRITVTMVARDDANRAQSGIHRIQLVARTAGGDEGVGSQDYPLVRRPNCEGMPEARTLVLSYTVPRNPPPIVRLVAVTEDHVGLSDHDHAEFPTGDWYGTFTMRNPTEGSQQTHARADIALNHDGKGNLAGTMVGEQELIASRRGNCSFKTNQPNRFRMTLVGSYTEGHAPKVLIQDVEETKLKVGVLCDATPPQQYEDSIRTYVHIPYFLGTPSPMGEGELLADGSRQYKWDAGTAIWTVALRRAPN